jgi:hypothetical protein
MSAPSSATAYPLSIRDRASPTKRQAGSDETPDRRGFGRQSTRRLIGSAERHGTLTTDVLARIAMVLDPGWNGEILPMNKVEIQNGAIHIEASIVAQGLEIAPLLVHAMMREGKITGSCERGVNEDAGRYRLTFFHKSRRLRVIVGADGAVIQRSVIDFGDRPLPALMRNVNTDPQVDPNDPRPTPTTPHPEPASPPTPPERPQPDVPPGIPSPLPEQVPGPGPEPIGVPPTTPSEIPPRTLRLPASRSKGRV